MYNRKQNPKTHKIVNEDGSVWLMDNAEFYVWWHTTKRLNFAIYDMQGKLIGSFDANNNFIGMR